MILVGSLRIFRLYIWVSTQKYGFLPPKSSILIGFSIINHPFGGTIIFGNIHIVKYNIGLGSEGELGTGGVSLLFSRLRSQTARRFCMIRNLLLKSAFENNVFLDCWYQTLVECFLIPSSPCLDVPFEKSMPDLLIVTMVVSVFGNPPQNGSEIESLGCRIYIIYNIYIRICSSLYYDAFFIYIYMHT